MKKGAFSFLSASVVAAASEVTKEKRWRSSYLGPAEKRRNERDWGGRGGRGEGCKDRTHQGDSLSGEREERVDGTKENLRCGQKMTNAATENEKTTWSCCFYAFVIIQMNGRWFHWALQSEVKGQESCRFWMKEQQG